MAWTTSSGVSLKYECHGEGASLVFLHELGGSLHSWDSLVEHLGTSVRVLRYDQRGAGMSEKVRQPFSMDDHVRDLEAIIADAKAEGPHILVSCAAGAGIALRFAEKHADCVGGLVLCCPALSVDERRRKYLNDRSELAASDGMWAVAAETLARSYPESLVTDDAVYEDYKARFLANDPVSYGLANRALAEADSRDLGRDVQCDCLVMAGKYDLLRPEAEVRGVVERFPHARFALIKAGHLPHVQAPAELAEYIGCFLAEREPKAESCQSREVT